MSKKIPGMTFPRAESRQVGLLASDAEIQHLAKQSAEEDYSKLCLLCRHYRIQAGPIMFYELSLALARDLYPEPKKPGRKSKWTTLNLGALVVEIERIARPEEPDHGVAWGAKQLAKREPWKTFVKAKESGRTWPDPAEALRQAYYSFKDNRWAEVMRDVFKMHDHQGTIAAWEEQVADYVKHPHPE
jgi:hypothetical protein